jgi:diaminohydroxyphosphoribosylaminopyrimidine deaminase/5-amino-6-(5-phosphoribosylamino)uracil reductase
MFDAFDHQCMAQALRLARRGLATTDPNPRVGCVLARNGEVVGSGWHRKAGEAHAEIHALREAGGRSSGATAYVTLEPCNHQGRTGACAKALTGAGISRVVCSTVDPNPRVNGGGLKDLEAAGIQVQSGLLEEQAEELNQGFFSRMRRNRPWVRVKLAQSLDGGTALANGVSQWISSEPSRTDVQRWRERSSAIMTGIGTVLADDPSLDVRTGSTRQPLRVIVDSQWRTPASARTLRLPGQVLIAGRQDRPVPAELKATGALTLPLPADQDRVDLSYLMTALAEREVNELQVEAGAELAGALLQARLVDELLIYQAPLLLGSGTRTAMEFGPLQHMQDRIRLDWIETCQTGPDLRLRLQPRYGED